LSPNNLEIIVQEWSGRLNLPAATVRTYLTENIHYYLDPPCLEGLALFYRYAADMGALPPASDLRFLSG
jgi:chorismate dehydratase